MDKIILETIKTSDGGGSSEKSDKISLLRVLLDVEKEEEKTEFIKSCKDQEILEMRELLLQSFLFKSKEDNNIDDDLLDLIIELNKELYDRAMKIIC